jgi:chromosome partitioning protein
MRTLAIVSQKGGVGKTSTAVNLSAHLARHGLRVLLVDLDAQAAASALLTSRSQPSRGTLDVLLGEASLTDSIVSTPLGVELCAAVQDLARAELALAAEMGRESILKDALTAAPRRWDLVVFDTPPGVSLATVNALVAAEAVLTPVMPAYLGLLAVQQLEETLRKVRARMNRDLVFLGYLLVAVDARERLSKEAREALRAHAGEGLWGLEVRIDSQLKAAADGVPIQGRSAEDYEAIAFELARRLDLKIERSNVRPDARSNISEVIDAQG